MSEKALQLAEKRSEAKGKRERERYIPLNVEFQIIPKREKKAFLSEQCKEIEENNRMGEMRYLFTKIEAIKGTFHARVGRMKDRNCKDLTEAEEIKKNCQEYVEELYRKDLNSWMTMMVWSLILSQTSWSVK